MKIVLCLLLTAISGSVFAEAKPLPPVVDNSVFVGGASYTSKPSSNDTLNEILGRMEQLQVELQQLRGVVEEQAYAITQLKKRQNNIYADLDQRMQNVSSGQNPTQPEAMPVQIAPPVKPADLPTESSSNEKQQYQDAYDTLRNGHNTKAIADFNAFLSAYPNGEYADNAQYWLGEAYKVVKDVNSAREAFNRLVANYPNSTKVPDALYKLGVIEMDQNNPVKARDYFTKVTVGYPGTTAAHLANKKIQQLAN